MKKTQINNGSLGSDVKQSWQQNLSLSKFVLVCVCVCEVDGARRQFPLLEKCVAKKNSRKMFEPKDKLDNLMRKNAKGKL